MNLQSQAIITERSFNRCVFCN